MIDLLEGTMLHSCGQPLQLRSEPGTFRIHGIEVHVEHRFLRCDTCDEELVTEELADLIEAEAASAFREQEGYLSGDEIRAIRERFGLTQEQLEATLAIGPKSLARWENERVIPNRGMDNLLRLIQRDPSTLVFLAERNGVTLPDTPALRVATMIDVSSWPRDLLTALEVAATEQETDLNSYLLWLLSQWTSSRTYERTPSSPSFEGVRLLQADTYQRRSAYGSPMYVMEARALHPVVAEAIDDVNSLEYAS